MPHCQGFAVVSTLIMDSPPVMAQTTLTPRIHLLPDMWSLWRLLEHSILQLAFLLFQPASASTHGIALPSGFGIIDCTALSAALPGLVYTPGTQGCRQHWHILLGLRERTQPDLHSAATKRAGICESHQVS
jgi:hypothetical protein